MSSSEIYAAIPTPFTLDEQIAFDQLERNFDQWLDQPLAGLVVLGTAGEAVYVTKEERSAIWKFSEDRLHRAGRRFIVGAGAEFTRDTIEYVHLAQELGADAALVLTPSFFRPSQEALKKHYFDVADSASIPILLYNYPAVTGVDLSSLTVTTLAEHPRIVGIKDSSANIIKLSRIRSICPGFQIYTGIASTVLSFLSSGCRWSYCGSGFYRSCPA